MEKHCLSSEEQLHSGILFSLIRSELMGVPIDAKISEKIDDDLISSLFSLSDAHDIAHIVASALCKGKCLAGNANSMKLRNKAMQAVYRYELLSNELQKISQTLEAEKVAFVPLKGAVIRDYYPESWMRTSCDIDILVKEEDLEKAVSLLKDKLNYSADTKCNYYHISLYSQSGVHIELHFSIKKGNATSDKVLGRVWDYATPVNENSTRYKLNDEFFIFYFIAHTASHFLVGGCGVRALIDLYFIEAALEYDEQLLLSLLQEAGLVKFYENLRKLSRVWLCDEEHTSITKQMEKYILLGGLFGTVTNHVAVRQTQMGGRLKYAIRKIFLPYRTMKRLYPFLEKHAWVFPFMQIVRWVTIICTGRTQASIRKLTANATLEEEKVRDTKTLLEQLGL